MLEADFADTILGVVFVCLGVLYAFVARRIASKQRSSVTRAS